MNTLFIYVKVYPSSLYSILTGKVYSIDSGYVRMGLRIKSGAWLQLNTVENTNVFCQWLLKVKGFFSINPLTVKFYCWGTAILLAASVDLVGSVVVLRINVDLAIFQPYIDFEAELQLNINCAIATVHFLHKP